MFNPLIKRPGSFESVQLRTILNLLEAINTPISLSIAIALRHGEEVKKDIRPSDYQDVRGYILDSQAVALVKKGTAVKTKRDITLESLEHFYSVDKGLPSSMREIENNFQDRGFIYECQRMIRRILGDVPDFKDLPIDKSFTTGATAGFKLTDSTLADKVSRTIDVSPHALPYLIQMSKGNLALHRLLMTHGFTVIPSSEHPYTVEVVPKQWDKKRVIIKHHFGDVLCQRTIARVIRLKLKRWGIDIENGKSIHEDVLRLFADCFATIDLSDASDRISFALVELMLPLEWFLMLRRLKNDFITDGTNTLRLNKFCGQGNGFTFELETLIFFVIASVAVKRNGQDPKGVFVYGDDTIVPEASAHAVMDAYEKCGLVVNKEKSFTTGLFKESCGYDTFDGIQCRPIYFKDFKPNENKAVSITKLHNRTHAVLEYLFHDIHYNSSGYRALVFLRSRFKPESAFYGPPTIGDSVLFSREEPPKWDSQRHYFNTYGRTYDRESYVLPSEDEASELAYMFIDGGPKGSLRRNSSFSLRKMRIYGVDTADRR